MLIQFVIFITIGCILYKLADHYFRRYLGFKSNEHTPIYTSGSDDASSLVCVLGWGGCTRRHLRRILDFYTSNGIPTVSYINPMLNYIFGIDMKEIEHLLDFLLKENPNSNKIIIHLHSNNGALVWGHMLDVMKTNERYKHLLSNIKGIILDSAPYVRFDASSDWLIMSAIGTSQACVSIILHRAQYFHFIWSPLVSYYVWLRYFYRRYFSSNPSFPTDKILQLLNSMPTDIRQCYLYGADDHLIPSDVIEQFMARQVEHGAKVTSHRFTGSEHVNHFRTHPVEYGKIVLDFIASVG